MDPQSKYILFYSNNCVHSKEFLNHIYKNQPLFKKFIKINVENTNVKIPKAINAVPAIIIRNPRMPKPQIYIGDEVFQWYNLFCSRIQQNQEPSQSKPSPLGSGTSSSVGGILDFDPCTMSGFSDNFSLLSLDSQQNNPIEHQFAFLGGLDNQGPVQGPISLDSQNQTNDDMNSKSELEQRLEQLQASRAMEVPKPPNRQGGGP